MVAQPSDPPADIARTVGGDLAALDDHAFAHAAATLAGELLLEVRAAGAEQDADHGGFGSRELRDRGDRLAHELLMELIGAARPDDAVLSEEGADDHVRLAAERVWIVDPLDGTREFGEGDRTDWAVHVALWERGDLVAGAVALPSLGTTLSTVPTVAPPEPSPAHDPPILVVSRTRPPAIVDALTARLELELLPMGSAGAKVSAVVLGQADCYVHSGGQYEWDSAAPVAVARAAGLHTSRLDGSPLEYNRENPSLPDLVICRPELAERLLAAIATLVPATDPDTSPATDVSTNDPLEAS